MRVRALLCVPAVVLGLGVAPASADTLFTGAGHTARVSVGAIASLASGTLTAKTGSTIVNDCAASTLDLQIEQNTTSLVSGTLTSGTFTGCSLPTSGVFPWRFTVRGSGVTSGTSTVFTNATWDDVSATLWGATPGSGTLSGATGSPPANGVYVREGVGSGSSICFVLSNAGTLSGPLLSNGRIDATYCLEGAAATGWSLGTTVTSSPTTLYTTPAHTTRVTPGAAGSLTWQTTSTLNNAVAAVCPDTILTFQLTQNTGSGVAGTITGGALNCMPFTYQGTYPWSVTIGVTRQVVGSNLVFFSALVDDLAYDYGSIRHGVGTLQAAGSPTATGVTATQPAATAPFTAGAPLCLEMDHAAAISDSLYGPSLLVDGQACFSGATSGGWSFG